MNKKSLLMMMVTICLIAVVGVGATLAYLTSSTTVLNNTFTLGKVKINIEEPEWENNNPNPSDIVPGQTFDKDPTVTVVKNSVNSYVFMSVDNVDEMIAAGFMLGEFDENGDVINAIDPAWVKVVEGEDEDEDETIDGIYVYSDKNGAKVVAKDDEDTELPALFKKVTYLNNDSNTELEDEITYNLYVKAAAVQATGEEGYTYLDAYNAVKDELLDFTE